ncbi:MAG: hypothetical protein AB7E26_03160 [Chryseobacterium sp.]
MKKLFILPLLVIFTQSFFGQAKELKPDKKYPADSLRQWTSGLMDEISKKHPGFYRYTDKGKFGLLIDSTQQSIQDSLTQLQYYRKLKPLFAKIGCLHTGIELPEESKTYLDTNLLPLELFVEAKTHKVLVSKNYSDKKNIQIGGEVVSINGTPNSVILNKLLAVIPSDGYNQTEKILLLNYRFPFWYQEIIDAPKVFKVVVRSENTEQTFDLNGASKDVFPPLEKLEKNYGSPLEFDFYDICKLFSYTELFFIKA